MNEAHASNQKNEKRVLVNNFPVHTHFDGLDESIGNHQVDLLRVIRLVHNTWSLFKPKTLINCLARAGLREMARTLEENVDKPSSLPDADLFVGVSAFPKMIYWPLKIRNELAICGQGTISAVVQDVHDSNPEYEQKVEILKRDSNQWCLQRCIFVMHLSPGPSCTVPISVHLPCVPVFFSTFPACDDAKVEGLFGIAKFFSGRVKQGASATMNEKQPQCDPAPPRHANRNRIWLESSMRKEGTVLMCTFIKEVENIVWVMTGRYLISLFPRVDSDLYVCSCQNYAE